MGLTFSFDIPHRTPLLRDMRGTAVYAIYMNIHFDPWESIKEKASHIFEVVISGASVPA